MSYETMTRAERLGLKTKPAKKKVSKKDKFLTWKDINILYSEFKNNAFNAVDGGNVKTLSKSAKRKKNFNMAMDAIIRCTGPLVDKAHDINVDVHIHDAVLQRNNDVIFKIDVGSSCGKKGQCSMLITKDWEDKHASIYDVIDDAFDAMLGAAHNEYVEIVKNEYGEDVY